MNKIENRPPGNKKRGVVLGGSGLIGGTLMYYFKRFCSDEYEILAPNSKRLSLREPDDIIEFFRYYRPDFIINSAIASIDSDAELAYEINYLGSINLAKIAIACNCPYIHISSAATLPPGENLTEEDRMELHPSLSNYAKSKLMAELTLEHLARTEGLDYTVIRLAVVYGTHDHKIQGLHRMLFSIVNQAMPVLLTRPGVMHSYSNASKLPWFVHHTLMNRDEFSGEAYNFVDKDPVELSELILKIKNYLEVKRPRKIYVPYTMAKMGKNFLEKMIAFMTTMGIETKMPGELIFMDNFYQSQSLSAGKILRSSFNDPEPDTTIFTALPDLIQYYLTRWEQLNLIKAYNEAFYDPRKCVGEFSENPVSLLNDIHEGRMQPFIEFNPET
jgi:nucleoside-diphosphate-sugar epimerase